MRKVDEAPQRCELGVNDKSNTSLNKNEENLDHWNKVGTVDMLSQSYLAVSFADPSWWHQTIKER